MSEKRLFMYRGFVVREYKNFYKIDGTDMVFDTREDVEDYIDMYYYC